MKYIKNKTKSIHKKVEFTLCWPITPRHIKCVWYTWNTSLERYTWNTSLEKIDFPFRSSVDSK